MKEGRPFKQCHAVQRSVVGVNPRCYKLFLQALVGVCWFLNFTSRVQRKCFLHFHSGAIVAWPWVNSNTTMHVGLKNVRWGSTLLSSYLTGMTNIFQKNTKKMKNSLFDLINITKKKGHIPRTISKLPLMGIESWATGRDTTASGVAKTPSLYENSTESCLDVI